MYISSIYMQKQSGWRNLSSKKELKTAIYPQLGLQQITCDYVYSKQFHKIADYSVYSSSILDGFCWQDFAHYKSGVYRYITGDAMGGHAVKLIGWGTTDTGEDYWVSLPLPIHHLLQP